MPNRPSRSNARPEGEPTDEDTPAAGQRAVQSVEVGGRLLLALAAQRESMSLKDLAAAAEMSPARAHPYLVSFGRLRLVQQDQASGRYALGPAALQMGLAALHQLDAVRTAETVAERLAQRSGYAVAVAVWGNFGPTVVRMIEARAPLLISMRAGTVMAALGTATGRAFAAVLPRDRIGQVVSPMNEDALATIAAARRDVQAHGVVRARGRPIPGINAFSAPVFDHEGQAALVITALGREDAFPVDWNAAGAQAVRDAAREVSQSLGWYGPATGR